MTKTIYRFTLRTQWEKGLREGTYVAEDFDVDGFIHLSTKEQLIETANLHASRKQELVLLVIDTKKVKAPLKFEASRNGDLFPHIYGDLNLDAVIAVHDFPPNEDGTFSFTF